MHDCGCYDPGFILRLLLGDQNGRAVNVWLQNRIKETGVLPIIKPLSESDVIWLSEKPIPVELKSIISFGHKDQDTPFVISDLNIDVKGAQGFKSLLDNFINLAQNGSTIIQLKYARPEADADSARIHLSIRLLRAILLKMNSEIFLLPDNRQNAINATSFFGNTLNEAHLVYNDRLPETLLKSVHETDSVLLNQLTEGLKLPGLNVAYVNPIPANCFKNAVEYELGLTISLVLSGLPVLIDLPEDINPGKVAQLLRARSISRAFLPASAQMSINLDRSVFAMLKISPDADQLLLNISNLSQNTINIHIPADRMGIPADPWRDIISGDCFSLNEENQVVLAPFSSLWLLNGCE
ncbi:MAG: hypothetical protein LWX83_15980 [Anaerolineae bacterium]|nr:hypothetical protein [Anaerolineae bacterium]